MPRRRFLELTVLRRYPHLAHRYPDGDLARMPNAELAELVRHAWAEDETEAARLGRVIAVETAKLMMPVV